MSSALLVWLLSVAPPAAQPDDPYVGNQMCVRCHEDVQTALTEIPHGGTGSELADNGCQSCHGPGRAHVQNPARVERHPSTAKLSVAEQNALCDTCHTGMASFDRTHTLEAQSCSSCHTLHVRDDESGIMAWQANCIACHGGNADYDALHAYDADSMASGRVSCRSCHRQPAHQR